MKNKLIHSIGGLLGRVSAVAACVACLNVQAGMPKPDNILYGAIIIDQVAITDADTHIRVEARRATTSEVVASYRMGDRPNTSGFFSLPIKREASAPLANASAAVEGEELLVLVFVNDEERARKAYVVSAMGEATRLDFGSQDGDGNGILDEWENEFFNQSGIDPNADPDGDGRNNLTEFRQKTNPLVSDTPHPADRDPADLIMSTAEIAAYAEAWKLGETWGEETDEIPMDFVSRGASLFHTATAYRVNPTAAPAAPLWWVNDLVSADGVLAADTVNSAIRTTPATIAEYVPLIITLTINPPTGATAYVVEENLPTSWLASEISADGALDTVNRKVKWGPFYDRQPRTLTYQVTAADLPNDMATVSGTISFNGVSGAISGHDSLRRAPVGATVLAAQGLSQSGFQLQSFGVASTEYIVEASSDLKNWTEVSRTQADGSGRLIYVDDSAMQSSSLFYRFKEVEDDSENGSRQ